MLSPPSHTMEGLETSRKKKGRAEGYPALKYAACCCCQVAPLLVLRYKPLSVAATSVPGMGSAEIAMATPGRDASALCHVTPPSVVANKDRDSTAGGVVIGFTVGKSADWVLPAIKTLLSDATARKPGKSPRLPPRYDSTEMAVPALSIFAMNPSYPPALEAENAPGVTGKLVEVV